VTAVYHQRADQIVASRRLGAASKALAADLGADTSPTRRKSKTRRANRPRAARRPRRSSSALTAE
jgi:hypothetical protein